MKKLTIKKIVSILETLLKLDDIELIHCSIESLLDDLKDLVSHNKDDDELKK